MKKNNINQDSSYCLCCGGMTFEQNIVLWPELVKEWGISKEEEQYINKQQGYHCVTCGSSLRSMSLASAVMRCYGYDGLFKNFVKEYRRSIDVLEINEAGNLNQYLKTMKKHVLGSYPQVRMETLPYETESMDLVIHSDTLEHVEDPIKGLQEIYRVLKHGGFTCFTIPVIVDRLTRSRKNLTPSFHGSPDNDEYLVMTEYGADMWTQVMLAGFKECRLYSFEYPASIVITGIK